MSLSSDTDTKTHHSVPRLSASKMERVMECGAAYAREWEMHSFLKANGMEKLESGSDADRGTQIHDLLAKIPFSSAKLDMGEGPRDWSAYKKVENAIATTGFECSKAEFWFCVHAIAKRDMLIEHVISEAGGALRVSLSMDKSRMAVTKSWGKLSESISGLADVLVSVERPDGGVSIAIVDYKTLYGEHLKSTLNVQLATLAALARETDVRVDKSYVSLVTNTQQNDEIDVAFYDSESMRRASERIDQAAKVAAELVAATRSEMEGGKALSELSQARLEAASKTGNHCLFCSGKMCCTKLRREMSHFEEHLIEHEPWVREYRRIITTPDMTVEETAQALQKTKTITDRFKLYLKLESELEEVTKKLISSGRSVEGFALKDGVSRLSLRTTVQPPMDESMLYDIEPEKIDVTPHAVYGKLRPLLQQVTGAEVAADDFIKACCTVSPNGLRDYLAKLAGVSEKAVYEKLLAPLGDANPLQIKKDKPSVVVVANEKKEAVEKAQEEPKTSRKVAA